MKRWNVKINLVSVFFALDNEKSLDIKKNDISKIKILVSKNNLLPKTIYKGSNMKEEVRDKISKLIGSKVFHLEQVFTMDYEKEIDIIYLGITNIENVSKLDNSYKLIDFKIVNNSKIIYGEEEYSYKTIEKEKNNNIEYTHDIKVKDDALKRDLLSVLIGFKKLRSSLDNTDIIFKFMGKTFTLESVRGVYELIKDKSVDKSNFRKKIMKYCEEAGSENNIKRGYRPSKLYKFKVLKGDKWI